jgi:transcriptional regulator with XRE-family HTH domain
LKQSIIFNDNFSKDYRIKLGDAIKEIRKERGYSQEELAEIMQISRSTISKIENGKFAFSVDYLSKLGWYLKFEIELIPTVIKK